MKHFIFIFFTLSFALLLTNKGYTQDTTSTFDKNIKKIQEHGFPKWFTDAKVGVFIHWGVYSVPSYAGRDKYAEWYLLGSIKGSTFNKNFEDKYFGKNWDYRQYAPLLKGELFNADEWAELFKNAGAKYVILVSKHHDGFSMWQSKYSPNWNSVEVGLKRDVVGEVTDAVRKKGLKMGLYYSLPEWNNPLYRWVTDPKDKLQNYLDTYMVPQFKELITKYKPTLLFSDGDWDHNFNEWHSDELITWYYDVVGKDAIVNDRWGNNGPQVGYKTPEYSSGLLNSPVPWVEVRGLGRSFGLNRNEPLEDYMTTQDLIHFLAKAVALGGGITINVGPGSDGQIPLLQQERLLQLGEWLDINGEAIYASRPLDHVNIEEKQVELKRVDPTIDFYWKRSSPGKPIEEDLWNAEWTAYLKPEFSETYHFKANADDNLKLFLNGACILDTKVLDSLKKNDTIAYKQELRKASVFLTKDKLVEIKALLTETTHEAEAHVYWSSYSTPEAIIPRNAVFTQNNINSPNGFNAKYTSKATTLCYTQNDKAVYAIMLQWPQDDKIQLDIKNINPNSKITMLGVDKSLNWKIVDNKVVVDLSTISVANLPSMYAWTLKIEK